MHQPPKKRNRRELALSAVSFCHPESAMGNGLAATIVYPIAGSMYQGASSWSILQTAPSK